MMINKTTNDTICAIATPSGVSAIAIIRISGENSIKICNHIFKPLNKKIKFSDAKSHTIHLGNIYNEAEMIDEVLVSVFKAPHSYTGEDSVEISCHGSVYIQQQIIETLIRNGSRLAKPGEFTLRAFLNKKLDLSQAEAVADLIAASSEASHKLALQQMRGGYSGKIKDLRQQLLQFASLIELELDFSEEDVEFANRKDVLSLISIIKNEIDELTSSFSTGNAIKQGIPVVIIGKPNVGKSTLLNALLNEEKAIVSEIPGTTRDAIEDTMNINGVTFRFIDTAGLREPDEEIENLGVEKTYKKINQAQIILYVVDISETHFDEIKENIHDFTSHLADKSKRIIVIANKIDKLVEIPKNFKHLLELETIFISARRKENIKSITETILTSIDTKCFTGNTVLSNARHYEALLNCLTAIQQVEKGIEKHISTDLLTVDIRKALHHLSEITGEVTTDDILNNIFSNFCIGK